MKSLVMIPFVAFPSRSSSFLLCASSRTKLSISAIRRQPQRRPPQERIQRWMVLPNDKQTELEDAADFFQPYFNFPLDTWQIEAGKHIVDGKSVICAAPTGAGKTVVGEMALRHVLEKGRQGIYTTPLKALSNQKFLELRKLFGSNNVGLSTGDMTINRNAPIVVMTTEVYRNMAWRETNTTADDNNLIITSIMRQENRLANVAVVVFDEFHYMGLKGRGGVWEESVITSQSHTQIVALSATLPNANRLANWIESVTLRPTELVVAQGKRPVPLRYLFATSDGLFPLFHDPDAGPGAPKGLLGLRGDGLHYLTEESETKKNKKIKGFQENDQPKSKKTSFPRGLQLHSDLRRRAEQVSNKVDRLLDKEERKFQEESRGRGANYNREEERRTAAGRSSVRKLSAHEEKRKRDQILKREMRRAVPELHVLLKRLQQKDILPAIFFIFSRVGCENAAKEVCKFMLYQQQRQIAARDTKRTNDTMLRDRDGRTFRDVAVITDEKMVEILERDDEVTKEDILSITLHPFSEESLSFYANQGLLPLKSVEEVAARVKAFNKENEEIAFSDEIAVQFMLGVSSHHAGQLAAHKAFVESLFQSQLMKVVFATETLAAGINMPARTTVICSMSKRGDGASMNLLETSNLLQMAGRAGRRGMDSDGTCVIVATPFEGPEDAASILLSEIKPISSQFSPSYTLALNLIARGAGKLDVARDLVQKSFAMWEKRQLESSLESSLGSLENEQSAESIKRKISQENFMSSLNWVVVNAIEQKTEERLQITSAKLEECLSVLASAKSLRKAAYSYEAMTRILTLERTTLGYLQKEADELNSYLTEIDRALLGIEADFAEFTKEDTTHIVDQIQIQKARILKNELDLENHPFASLAVIANDSLYNGDVLSDMLPILAAARGLDTNNYSELEKVSADEIVTFAKACKQIERKRRDGVLISTTPGETNLEQKETPDNAFTDILSIIKVLNSYGCLLSHEDLNLTDTNSEAYEITSAGKDVSLLNFDNSLWALCALGGAWDVKYHSHGLDELQRSLDTAFYVDENNEVHELNSEDSLHVGNNSANIVEDLPAMEAEELISSLRCLSAFEIAGYVSCLVSEGSTRDGSFVDSSYMSFENLSRPQQDVVRTALLAAERLIEVQTIFGLDDLAFPCRLDLSVCSVVTAWTAGCTWNEALEMSGMAPGDLARVLHRAMDALRQFGSLPFHAVRSRDSSPATRLLSCGIHPDIRKLCREAATAMNRYPLKDSLPLEEELIDASEVVSEFDLLSTEDDANSLMS